MTDDSDHVPADWYPDAEGKMRWWDGSQWTEHVQDQTAVLERVPQQSTRRAETTSDDDDDNGSKRRTWLVATFIGLLAFFLGLGIGGRGSPDIAEPPIAAEATASSGETVEELDERETALEEREGDLTSRQQELDQREQDVARRETEIEDGGLTGEGADTIGNGVFEVGSDVQPGQYSSAGPEDPDLPCSYRVSTDEDGDEIISSEIVDGPGEVVLEPGAFFTSEFCQEWTRQ